MVLRPVAKMEINFPWWAGRMHCYDNPAWRQRRRRFRRRSRRNWCDDDDGSLVLEMDRSIVVGRRRRRGRRILVIVEFSIQLNGDAKCAGARNAREWWGMQKYIFFLVKTDRLIKIWIEKNSCTFTIFIYFNKNLIFFSFLFFI